MLGTDAFALKVLRDANQSIYKYYTTEIFLKFRALLLYLATKYGRVDSVHRQLRKMLARAGSREPDELTKLMVAQRDSAFALAGAR